MFDTVHTGTTHAQTKGLGKRLCDYVKGDRVWLVESPSYTYRDREGGKRLAISDFGVTGRLYTTTQSDFTHWVWIIVRKQRLTEIVDTPPSDLPLFGYHGQYQAGPEPRLPLEISADADLPWIDPRQAARVLRGVFPTDNADPRNCGFCDLALRQSR